MNFQIKKKKVLYCFKSESDRHFCWKCQKTPGKSEKPPRSVLFVCISTQIVGLFVGTQIVRN